MAEDIPLLFSLMMDVFPGINYAHAEMDALKKIVADVCRSVEDSRSLAVLFKWDFGRLFTVNPNARIIRIQNLTASNG